MNVMEEAHEAIAEFVGLAREARRRALPRPSRERMEMLDEHLRDVIEGARPAPKRISSPAAAPLSGAPRPSDPSQAPAWVSPEVTSAQPQALAHPEARARVPSPSPEARARVPSPSPEARARVPSPSPEERARVPSPSPEDRARVPSPSPEARVAAARRSVPQVVSAAVGLDEVLVDFKDRGRLKEVVLADLHAASTYTRAHRPMFLEAYYGDALDEVSPAPRKAPRQVVDVEGEPVELPSITLDLWRVGTEAAPPARPGAPGRPDAAELDGGQLVGAVADLTLASPDGLGLTGFDGHAAGGQAPGRPADAGQAPGGHADAGHGSPPAPSEPPQQDPHARPIDPALPPAIVHLLHGGARRGFIDRFDATAGRLRLLGKDPGAPVSDIPLDEVLVIFFGRRPHAPAAAHTGVQVEVTLINDRRLVGTSPDYQPHGSALTVIPTTDRGGVERVWVPAWSVKTIAVA